MKHQSKMEYSKKILIVLMAVQVVIILYSMALMWHTQDATALAYLIPSLSAELSVAVGFYYNKAKRENEIKIREACKRLNLTYEEDDDELGC